MGRSVALRNAPAAVLPAWDETLPGYGNVLGMLAFGYEECGEYTAAEDAGRRGVARNPDDLWALHAVAHVLEMQGRHEEGAAWLARPAEAWADRNPFRGHLWWHLALQQLDAGDTTGPLALYDRSIYNADSNFYLDIQNAASLLARLEFCNADVGQRWTPLADHAETHLDDHALAFTDLHCMMSLARTERFAAARRLIDSMTRHAEDPRSYAAAAMRAAALPLCRAILAFGEGRWDDAVALFLPLRHANQIVGASHAQREILALYLVVAAIRGGNRSMAEALLRERAALKPGSAITQRLMAGLAASS
jgi:tetratricopeptide (TPR) repeat protein